MKWLVKWIMRTKLYAFIMRHVIWRIRFSTKHTRFNGAKFAKLTEVALPGRFILTVDDKKLTTFLIPGITSHAAFISDQFILDMINSGMRRSFLFDQAQESDRIIVMTGLTWDSEYKKKMCSYANYLAERNIKYDIDFKLGVEELYCSELIYKIDNEKRLGCDLSDLVGLNKPYISPDGLLFAEHAVCVWDSDEKFTDMTGPQIERSLKLREQIS